MQFIVRLSQYILEIIMNVLNKGGIEDEKVINANFRGDQILDKVVAVLIWGQAQSAMQV